MGSLFPGVQDEGVSYKEYEPRFYHLVSASLGAYEPRLEAAKREVEHFFAELKGYDPEGRCLPGLYALAVSEQNGLGLTPADLRTLFVRYLRPYPNGILAWSQMLNLWDSGCHSLGAGIFMLILRVYAQQGRLERIFFHRLIPMTLADMKKTYEQVMQVEHGEMRGEFLRAYRQQEERLRRVTFELLRRYKTIENARQEAPKSFPRVGLGSQYDEYIMRKHVESVLEEMRNEARESILPHILLPPESYESATSRIEGISPQEEQILKMELPLTCPQEQLRRIAYLRRIKSLLSSS